MFSSYGINVTMKVEDNEQASETKAINSLSILHKWYSNHLCISRTYWYDGIWEDLQNSKRSRSEVGSWSLLWASFNSSAGKNGCSYLMTCKENYWHSIITEQIQKFHPSRWTVGGLREHLIYRWKCLKKGHFFVPLQEVPEFTCYSLRLQESDQDKLDYCCYIQEGGS